MEGPALKKNILLLFGALLALCGGVPLAQRLYAHLTTWGFRVPGYGPALRDCSFRLPAGRVCALVGPNGAGKTTLLSLAAGLLEPSTGTIRLGGHAARSAEARRHTAFLGQEKALYPRFRVSDTLRIGRELNPAWHQETA